MSYDNTRAMRSAEADWLSPPEYPECDCRPTSDCCGAEIVQDSDDICGQCRDHCGLEQYCHCEEDEEEQDRAAQDRRDEERADDRF